MEKLDTAKIIERGYSKPEGAYGNRLRTENYTHWITIYGDDDMVQMYAYLTSHEFYDDEKYIYDTGIVKVNDAELQVLIDVLVKNHI
jgi:hypothetical protein